MMYCRISHVSSSIVTERERPLKASQKAAPRFERQPRKYSNRVLIVNSSPEKKSTKCKSKGGTSKTSTLTEVFFSKAFGSSY